MALGVTRIFPGTVGNEYHMTKGHIHERNDQPEIYYCVHGEGFLLLDTLDGEFRAVPWKPGVITHIPPMWAHRVVNTGDDLLVFVAAYHLSAGHDEGLPKLLSNKTENLFYCQTKDKCVNKRRR